MSFAYDTQCYRDYYYGKDKLWETNLSTLESKWGIIFQKILADEPLTSEDMCLIKQFAMYQLQRTVAFNDHMINQREGILCEYGKLLCKRKGLVFGPDVANYFKELAKSKVSTVEALAFADEFVCLIQDLELTVIIYDTKQDLISSDVPVIAINPFHQPSIGYGCMGLIILFPISDNHLVVINDAKMYPKNKGCQYINCSDEDEVSNLNILQLISADKILLAKSDLSFSFISDVVLKKRDNSRSKNSVSFLGNGDNRLMVIEPRKVIHKYDFSFGRVCHRFKRIPFVCKEAPPRKWDIKWEEKLNMKDQILPTVINLSSKLSSEYGLSKKEIKRGCQRMATAAKVYWTQDYRG